MHVESECCNSAFMWKTSKLRNLIKSKADLNNLPDFLFFGKVFVVDEHKTSIHITIQRWGERYWPELKLLCTDEETLVALQSNASQITAIGKR